MRSDSGVDQAEGLRRLLVRKPTQVIALVAGKAGVGRTSMTLNLAAAMARSGKEVLVLDENHVSNDLLQGEKARYDLMDVIREKCNPSGAISRINGFAVLSTSRAMYSLPQMGRVEQQRLLDALAEVSSGVDVMLVDAAMLMGQVEVPWSLAAGVSLLVVVDPTARGITDSYALIKRLALENARLQFEIVVNKVVDEQAATTVFGNMAKVARRNLSARLEYLGCIPYDDRQKRARQLGKLVVEAFPAAAAAKSYLELSRKLLQLPVPQDESQGGMRTMMQDLIRQVPQPLRHRSKKVAAVVN